MMTNEEFFWKLFAGGNSYWLTRFIILRLLGFVYAVSLLVAAQQLEAKPRKRNRASAE